MPAAGALRDGNSSGNGCWRNRLRRAEGAPELPCDVHHKDLTALDTWFNIDVLADVGMEAVFGSARVVNTEQSSSTFQQLPDIHSAGCDELQIAIVSFVGPFARHQRFGAHQMHTIYREPSGFGISTEVGWLQITGGVDRLFFEKSAYQHFAVIHWSRRVLTDRLVFTFAVGKLLTVVSALTVLLAIPVFQLQTSARHTTANRYQAGYGNRRIRSMSSGQGPPTSTSSFPYFSATAPGRPRTAKYAHVPSPSKVTSANTCTFLKSQ